MVKREYSIFVFNSSGNVEYDSEHVDKESALKEANDLCKEYESIDGYSLFVSVNTEYPDGSEDHLDIGKDGVEDVIAIDWLD